MKISHQKLVTIFFTVIVLAVGTVGQAGVVSYIAVDLNPSGFTESGGLGTSGTQQVGWGNSHALLWNGSAASYVNLNPSGFNYSVGEGISGARQVGWGYGSTTGGKEHALLWNGSAVSYVDLNPSGFTESMAYGISGTQ